MGGSTARRLTGLVAAAVALMMATAALAGCGVSKPAPGGAAHRGPLKSAVFINPVVGDPLWDEFGSCMRQAAARYGITLRSEGNTGGDTDVQAMENMVSQATADKVQAIITFNVLETPVFKTLFQRQRRQGGVVATMFGEQRQGQDFDISDTNAQNAQIIADAIARLGPHVRLGMIWQSADGISDNSLGLIKAQLRRHRNIRLLGVAYDQGVWSRDRALISTMLIEHPQINVVYEYNGSLGVFTAIRELHRIGKVRAVLNRDRPSVLIPFAKQGLVAAVGNFSMCQNGRLAIDRLRDAWAGKRVVPEYPDGFEFLSASEFERRYRAGDLG